MGKRGSKSPKICLAASGGGHVRQILDLRPLWQDRDVFFVTEDTALGQSIATEHESHFVAHVALGQAKLGAPVKMLAAAFKNMMQSFRIVWKQRPDAVITTGAGSVFFIVLFAKLFGARIALIDSFARFSGPSAFARIAAPFADCKIAQSPQSADIWKGSLLFDPFRKIEETEEAAKQQPKENLLFATVGATLHFDRLVELVVQAKSANELPESVIIQTGEGGALDVIAKAQSLSDVRVVETLPFEEMIDNLSRAKIVVCHGGTGSLITALREGCRVIAVPRRFEKGEHYDNHQAEITDAFHQRGLIQVADTPEEFSEALAAARAMEPVRATTDPAELIAFLTEWLAPQKPTHGKSTHT